jgi:hypothetical protein
METNQKIERASKAIKNAIDGLFFIDSGDIKILDGSKYLNNLLYNFSDIVNNIERIKDENGEIALNAYEERLKELASRNTDFGRGAKEILNLFQNDASFRAQFYTAFDCRFVPAIIMVNNGKTRKSGSRVMNVNVKDHIYNQMNNWKNQSFNSKIDQSKIQGIDDEDYSHVGEALGIYIEEDTFLDPDAAEIFEQLKNAILFLRKETTSYDFIKYSTVAELLTSLAEVNNKYSFIAKSKSSPPKCVSPAVDLTSNIPLSIVNIVTSNVPPPKSYTKIFFVFVSFNPYARAAAVGSLIIRTTSNPAIVPASFVAER